MTNAQGYSYHAGSKWIKADFMEGKPGDSIQNYVNRINWSDYELYLSNVGSFPPDVNNIIKPTPDYIIFEKPPPVSPTNMQPPIRQDLMILLEPDNPKIPSNFELLWSSDESDIVVYRINKD